MSPEPGSVLDAWRIGARATAFLFERVPADLWEETLPRSPRRTVRSIATHVHNSRCSWMKSLALGTGLSIPARLDARRASPRAVSTGLARSGQAILRMLEAGLAAGGEFPGVPSRFVWGAIPRDVTLFVAYAVAHEAHHRGQVLLLARELGRRLPVEVVAGLWQWSTRLKEARAETAGGRP